MTFSNINIDVHLQILQHLIQVHLLVLIDNLITILVIT
jgi:hypothetical protein